MSPLACSRHNLKGPDLKSNCFLYFISQHILFSLLKGLLLFAAKQVEQFKLINSDTYILVRCGYTPTCWIDEWFAYRFFMTIYNVDNRGILMLEIYLLSHFIHNSSVVVLKNSDSH